MKVFPAAPAMVLGIAVALNKVWTANAADEYKKIDHVRGRKNKVARVAPWENRNLARDASASVQRRRELVRSANKNAARAKANAVGKLKGQGFTSVKAVDAVPLGDGSILVYTAQEVKGIPVRGSDALVLTNSAGNVVKVPGLVRSVEKIEGLARPFNIFRDMSIVKAIRTYTGNQNFDCVEETETDGFWSGWTDCGGYKVRLSYFAPYKPKDKADKLHLAYEIHGLETSDDAPHFFMDASDGEILEMTNWVAGQLEVYDTLALGVLDAGSPNIFTNNSAFDAGLGTYWHNDGTTSYTYTRGNNVCAYRDASSSNPNNCGSVLSTNYQQQTSPGYYETNYDPTQDPTTAGNIRTATVNLFYWNNLIHDFLYGYGFDEASGNFQQNNFGLGGIGGDPVRAESQDGSGTNNANMMTPPDGGIPRMQMYRTTYTNPGRDTSLDNMVIAHEYGHGLSNRLTGGPSTSSCLNNRDQAGEGWSDLLGLFMTDGPQYISTTQRGTGTWSFNTNTIRLAMYTTDMSVNSYTYGDLASMSAVHQIGFLWATLYWEVYWELRNTVGFDEDITAGGSGGNNIAVQLFVDGLKLQQCSPTFIQARDAIIQADEINYQGAYKCLIWTGFAKRGLGSGATSSYLESYDLPPECSDPAPGVSCSPSAHVGPLGSAQYTSTCVVTSLVGYTGTVDLSCSTSSPGITCSVNSTVFVAADASEVAVLTINVGESQQSGAYSVTVNAQDSSDTSLSNNALVSVAIETPGEALYNPDWGVPVCTSPGSVCSSMDLLKGRGTVGPEANAPNTLDGCSDGNSGSYLGDESLERLVVRTLDESDFVEGAAAEIAATVYAWSTGTSDFADFYYAADASAPVWIFIATKQPPGGGMQVITQTYTLPAGSRQAVRVNFRYTSSANSCSTGSYNDRDDLVFTTGNSGPPPPTLAPASLSPTKSPATAVPTTSPNSVPTATPATPSPTFSPTKAPTAGPTKAPTAVPTIAPTTDGPTTSPNSVPTVTPATTSPTFSPTNAPTAGPTEAPTAVPTIAPMTDGPTTSPNSVPTVTPATPSPTFSPTKAPTAGPTEAPTAVPTIAPTTDGPTTSPNSVPTVTPATTSPTFTPTRAPTTGPTKAPTGSPTVAPTTDSPTTSPNSVPTVTPTTTSPTFSPTKAPTPGPTKAPTGGPTIAPTTDGPTRSPTSVPTITPATISPTVLPTTAPAAWPTKAPTAGPTIAPMTAGPTTSPNAVPTVTPATISPTVLPTKAPSPAPTKTPTPAPTPIPIACTLAQPSQPCFADRDCCSGRCMRGKPSKRRCLA